MTGSINTKQIEWMDNAGEGCPARTVE